MYAACSSIQHAQCSMENAPQTMRRHLMAILQYSWRSLGYKCNFEIFTVPFAIFCALLEWVTNVCLSFCLFHIFIILMPKYERTINVCYEVHVSFLWYFNFNINICAQTSAVCIFSIFFQISVGCSRQQRPFNALNALHKYAIFI